MDKLSFEIAKAVKSYLAMKSINSSVRDQNPFLDSNRYISEDQESVLIKALGSGVAKVQVSDLNFISRKRKYI